jgi:uncharacterized protein YggU (UPF0235/DUF167 family)
LTARLAVRLSPRGGADRIDGWGEDAAGRRMLRVRVSAPPSDGEANAALLRLLAGILRAPASSLAIVSGASARLKLVEVADLDGDELLRRLG